jgi:2-iminobutanoate/2-iminopropanoate deaminase
MITDLFSERIKVMKYISTDKAPAAIGPYSQAIVTGNLLFASGQIALDPATGAVKGETITEQTTTVCENIGEILKAAGTTYDKVVKTTCFLSDINDFSAFNEVYAKYFTSNPARSCVAVKDIPKGVKCEIEAIAEL